MNEPIYLTAKQIQRLRMGKTITIYRNKETIEIGKKQVGRKEAKIRARIAALRAKLKELKQENGKETTRGA